MQLTNWPQTRTEPLRQRHPALGEALTVSPRGERAAAFRQRSLERFAASLPRYPYATDDLARGLRIHRRDNALGRKYIQVGHYPHAVFRLVVDVDLPWHWVEPKFDGLPPSVMVINPHSNHFHAWYEIDPIPLQVPPEKEESLRQTLALLARVEAQLEAYYGADPGYTGLISRNPLLHPPEWTWGGGKGWNLRALDEELRALLPRTARRAARAEHSSYGRNSTLFDGLRTRAYAQVAAFRGHQGGQAAFQAWVEQVAQALNQELFQIHPKGRLDPREVHHIAKSVAKWTWNNYRGSRAWPVSGTGRTDRSRLSPQARALIPPLQGQGLQEAVREGGKRRGSRRRKEAEEKLTEALKRLQARGERITATALAREAGVHRNTAAKWLKRMRQ